jgi:FixJ family two-component response regulator
MSGTELAVALHRIRPGLPIILMTGYGRPVPPSRLSAAGIREILKKPLRSRDMAESMARHLRPSAALVPGPLSPASGKGKTADLYPGSGWVEG